MKPYIIQFRHGVKVHYTVFSTEYNTPAEIMADWCNQKNGAGLYDLVFLKLIEIKTVAYSKKLTVKEAK